jgi:toxin YoeB
MRSLVFEGKTWEVYEQLREQDKKQHQQLCKMLKEMLRNDPAQGLGKPEPLKHQFSSLMQISECTGHKCSVMHQNV